MPEGALPPIKDQQAYCKGSSDGTTPVSSLETNFQVVNGLGQLQMSKNLPDDGGFNPSLIDHDMLDPCQVSPESKLREFWSAFPPVCI